MVNSTITTLVLLLYKSCKDMNISYQESVKRTASAASTARRRRAVSLPLAAQGHSRAHGSRSPINGRRSTGFGLPDPLGHKNDQSQYRDDSRHDDQSQQHRVGKQLSQYCRYFRCHNQFSNSSQRDFDMRHGGERKLRSSPASTCSRNRSAAVSHAMPWTRTHARGRCIKSVKRYGKVISRMRKESRRCVSRSIQAFDDCWRA